MATDIIVEYGEHRNLLRAILAGFGHYMNYLNRLALNYVDEVICVSKRQCEIILKYLPELRNRAIVIYNLPPSLSSIGKRISKEPTLVYASGGSYIKGFNMFLEMLTRVLKRHECKIYVTYGRKTSSLERSLLDKLSQKLNSKLIVLGRLPYKEYLKLHEHVWSLLFPSIYEEPLPYAVVESMLMGTMPVAARVGGVPEVVGGSPAEEYLFTTGDVDEFVDKIEMLLSQSRDNIMDVGSKLREAVLKKFSPEVVKKGS
jgi:glycosyltransferase involved in cell wall biosynthesis